jgi:hypothetical protein
MKLQKFVITVRRSARPSGNGVKYVWTGDVDFTYANGKKDGVALPYYPSRKLAMASAMFIVQTVESQS